MISFENAFDIVMSRVSLLDTESTPLSAAAGRILAQDVPCDMDIPPFDKSAMDGYACRRTDLPGPFLVIETIQAGAAPEKTVGPGECAKIMTGAAIPSGADCVIMVEHTETRPDGKMYVLHSAPSLNICYQGEDARMGDIVLRKGARLGPPHIAVLATTGCAAPLVARRPRVGIIATGDELVEPDTIPGPSRIRNSNSYQIRAQIEQTCAIATYHGIAADTEASLDDMMKRAIAESDVLLLSGGVSMGDFDLVPDIMRKNGIEILFDAIATKPGKPTTFGVGPSIYCFGLPGNPVSTFVQCEILVKPFLYALMGHRQQPIFSWLPMAETYRRKKTDRDAWLPVAITDDGKVQLKTYHGSAHINALCDASGFLVVPQGVAEIERETIVKIRMLPT